MTNRRVTPVPEPDAEPHGPPPPAPPPTPEPPELVRSVSSTYEPPVPSEIMSRLSGISTSTSPTIQTNPENSNVSCANKERNIESIPLSNIRVIQVASTNNDLS